MNPSSPKDPSKPAAARRDSGEVHVVVSSDFEVAGVQRGPGGQGGPPPGMAPGGGTQPAPPAGSGSGYVS